LTSELTVDPQENRNLKELTSLQIAARGHIPAYGSFFTLDFFTFAHRASAAFRALALRSSGVSLAALVLPPLEPPIFPRAIA
jgi:hypothetical protein